MSGKDQGLDPQPKPFPLSPYPYGDAGSVAIYVPERNRRKCAQYARRKRNGLRGSYKTIPISSFALLNQTLKLAAAGE